MSEKFEINLFVKRLHPNAVIPTYAHPSDAGLDLTATLRPSEVARLLNEQPISLTTEYAEDNTQRFSREIIIKPIN